MDKLKGELTMKGIYRFEQDYGRMGSLRGIFVAEKEEVESAIGTRIHFGEVLGKHSDIHGELEADEITLVSDKPEDVEVFERLKLSNGFNPLSYINEEE